MNTRALSFRAAFAALAIVLVRPACAEDSSPGFPLDEEAWRATHIVLASREARSGGAIVVSECWKGDLKPGETLTVPFLAAFDDPAELAKDGPGGTRLAGARAVVFLERGDEKAGWLPSSRSPGRSKDASRAPSVAWVDSSGIYASYRGLGLTREKGCFPVADLRSSEDMKSRIDRVLAVKKRFDRVLAVKNARQRCDLLATFTGSELACASDAAFEALEACGLDAQDVLNDIYADEARARVHARAARALVEVRGTDIFVNLLDNEVRFYRNVAPSLEGPEGAERVGHHRTTALWILGQIRSHRAFIARETVKQFRDILHSARRPEETNASPSLESICDEILSAPRR